MPAKSQAQRGYLAEHFGVAWMRRHHFDNTGKLPEHYRKGVRDRKGSDQEPNPVKRKAAMYGGR